MVITQSLGRNAGQIVKPHGKAAIQKVIKDNQDIKKAIDASMTAQKSKPKKQRDLARQKAIVKAMKRNPAFEIAIQAALNRLVG